MLSTKEQTSTRSIAFGTDAREELPLSAQAGIWSFDSRPADREFLMKLGSAMEAQAPDGQSIYLYGTVGMLYRALHTTKESRLENQPYFSKRGLVITWDGRLDNREDLLSELNGNPGSVQTDVAIVAAAFDRIGTDCFCKLVGDWAVTVWDPADKMLIFAKDYMGMRHLYYYLTPSMVMWAKYLAPLVLLSNASFTINEEYIAGYFASYPNAHFTPYREVQSVPPGGFVVIQDGKARAPVLVLPAGTSDLV